ncbi:hypothetical protein ACIBQ1_11390 [Nonomuraea sp. NPDC050153]|uniref:hypothetical protein n=1 Tax=Nonomuraea sp. NPDC050153 TaxID=3364359 RepID=UPI0037B1A6F0
MDGMAGGMSARTLKELHGDVAEGLPFLFADRAQPPKPVFHYALPGLSEQDLDDFAALQRQAAAIARPRTRERRPLLRGGAAGNGDYLTQR